MKVDCNLRTLASFFKLSLCNLEKSLKTDHFFFVLGEKPYYFLPDVVRAIVGYNQVALTLFEQFWAK